jgi:hypothetical protein
MILGQNENSKFYRRGMVKSMAIFEKLLLDRGKSSKSDKGISFVTTIPYRQIYPRDIFGWKIVNA